jgi:hypothetical protein
MFRSRYGEVKIVLRIIDVIFNVLRMTLELGFCGSTGGLSKACCLAHSVSIQSVELVQFR